MATPEPLKFVFSLGKKASHFHPANGRVSCFVVGILQGQRLVVDKPAHSALLLLAGHQPVFEAQKPFELSLSAHIDQTWCAIDPRHLWQGGFRALQIS
jgi:hypothetical protein